MNIFQRTIAKVLNFDITNSVKIEQLGQFFRTAFVKWGSLFASKTAKNLNAMAVSANGLVYTCVNELAKAVVSAPRLLKQKINQTDTALLPLTHRAVRLFDSPNPIYSSIEYFSLGDKTLTISGNVFIYTPDFGLDFPQQMWLLETARVRIVMGEKGDLISGYEYYGVGGVMFFPEKYILHIRTLEPSNDPTKQLIGTGLIEAVLTDANIDNESRMFLKSYWANDARPPQIMTSPDKMFDTNEQWELKKEEWNRKNPNNKLHGYLYGGQKIEQLDGSSLDMNYKDVSQLTRQAIVEPFGMSLMLVEGTFGSRATATVMRSHWQTNSVNPRLALYSSAYTKHFQQWDSTIVVEFEEYKGKDSDEERLQEAHLFGTGQITINELLDKQGKAGIGAIGDVRFVPSNLVTLEKAVAPTPAPMKVGFSADTKQLTDGEQEKKNTFLEQTD